MGDKAGSDLLTEVMGEVKVNEEPGTSESGSVQPGAPEPASNDTESTEAKSIPAETAVSPEVEAETVPMSTTETEAKPAEKADENNPEENNLEEKLLPTVDSKEIGNGHAPKDAAPASAATADIKDNGVTSDEAKEALLPDDTKVVDPEKGLDGTEEGGARIPPEKNHFFRVLLKKEVLLCILGLLVFLVGLIMIIISATQMSGQCHDQDSHVVTGDAHVDYDRSGTHKHGEELHVTYVLKQQNISDGEALNLAQGKHAYQSSVWIENGIPHEASLAVDNNTDNHNLHGDCAQTEMHARPYWYVDLGDAFVINKVKLILPKDCCVGDLHNFEIRVGDNSDDLDLNTICKHHMGTALKTVLNIDCDKPMMGRYVSVQMLGDENRTTDTLTLCEVMVFA